MSNEISINDALQKGIEASLDNHLTSKYSLKTKCHSSRQNKII